MKSITKYILILFFGLTCTYAQAQIINPKKKAVKNYFKLANNEWAISNKFGSKKNEIGQFICSNNDSVFYKKDTIKFYSSNEYFHEDYLGNSYINIDFYKKNVVTFSGSLGAPTGWREAFEFKYYSKFLNIKSVRPKYFLSVCKGKTIMTIKRFKKPDEIFYIYKIEEQKKYDVVGINYIFTFVRIRK
jgi:hypothetical protein